MLIQSSSLHDNATCRRLVAAASEEFAQHGFAGARIRNIVDAARVNLASVNYYFGGKEGLYRATLGYLARQALRGFTERRGRTPEQRLHRIVYAFLSGLTEAPVSPPLGRIIAHESMHPTPHLDRLIEEMTRPQLERLRSAVRELVGPHVPDRDVSLAALGISGQCLIYQFGRPAIDRIFPGAIAGPRVTRSLARQISDFSLAGLARLSARYAAPAPASRSGSSPCATAPPAPKKGQLRGH